MQEDKLKTWRGREGAKKEEEQRKRINQKEKRESELSEIKSRSEESGKKKEEEQRKWIDQEEKRDREGGEAVAGR